MTVCTFCGEPIDGEPHWPHLDGCPRRTAFDMDAAIDRALSGAIDLTGLDHHQTVKAER